MSVTSKMEKCLSKKILPLSFEKITQSNPTFEKEI